MPTVLANIPARRRPLTKRVYRGDPTRDADRPQNRLANSLFNFGIFERAEGTAPQAALVDKPEANATDALLWRTSLRLQAGWAGFAELRGPVDHSQKLASAQPTLGR